MTVTRGNAVNLPQSGRHIWPELSYAATDTKAKSCWHRIKDKIQTLTLEKRSSTPNSRSYYECWVSCWPEQRGNVVGFIVVFGSSAGGPNILYWWKRFCFHSSVHSLVYLFIHLFIHSTNDYHLLSVAQCWVPRLQRIKPPTYLPSWRLVVGLWNEDASLPCPLFPGAHSDVSGRTPTPCSDFSSHQFHIRITEDDDILCTENTRDW